MYYLLAITVLSAAKNGWVEKKLKIKKKNFWREANFRLIDR